MINWESNVNHLGNKLNKKLEDRDDLRKKKGHFIGSVNKMFSNFENVQSAVLLKYFKDIAVVFMDVLYGNLIESVIINYVQLGIKLSGKCGGCHLLHIHVC